MKHLTFGSRGNYKALPGPDLQNNRAGHDDSRRTLPASLTRRRERVGSGVGEESVLESVAESAVLGTPALTNHPGYGYPGSARAGR